MAIADRSIGLTMKMGSGGLLCVGTMNCRVYNVISFLLSRIELVKI